MPLVKSKARQNSFVSKQFIPARWQSTLGRGKQFQISLPVRDADIAEALDGFLAEVRNALFRLLDTCEGLTEAEAKTISDNFSRLANTTPAANRQRPRGTHLYNELRSYRKQLSDNKTPDTSPSQADSGNVRQHLEAALALLNGHVPPEPDPNQRTPQAGSIRARPLSEVILAYLEEVKGNCTIQTWNEYDLVLRTFLEIVGERPIAEIDRPVIREYKEAILRLPLNWRRVYHGVPASEVLRRKNSGPTIKTSTANYYLQAVGSFFSWAYTNGFVAVHPAQRIKIPIKWQPEDERDQFTDDELKLIFERSRIYARNQNQETRIRQQTDPQRYHYYWFALISLFTGMRAGEIAGLSVADIELIDGVWGFQVRPNEFRTLKSRGARRFIPVHPRLIDLGLLTVMHDNGLLADDNLWPGLLPGGVQHHRISRWSSYWARYKRRAGITAPNKTFHSFRHTFVTRLVEVEDRIDIIADLTGHALKTETYSRYRKRVKPDRLLEAVSAIHYPVDLEHLQLSD